MAEFVVSDAAGYSASARFRIVSPLQVRILLADDTLNRIAELSAASGCAASEYKYQRTSVTVLVEGLDATSLATEMTVGDSAIAGFVASSSTAGDAVVVGKAAGSTFVRLHGASSRNVALTVVDVAVTVAELKTRVVTDVSWEQAPPGSYSFPATFIAAAFVQQKFTQQPAGSSIGDFGYLFSTAVYSDGAQEQVSGSETSVESFTSNVAATPPGSIDDSAGSSALQIFNNAPGADRWMLSVRRGAVSECVERTLVANFTRCGVVIATGFPIMHVEMPKALAVRFRITHGYSDDVRLTPLNGAASLAPFANLHTSTSSDFHLAVFYDDDSQIDTYGRLLCR
jgi:hypothetical protein